MKRKNKLEGDLQRQAAGWELAKDDPVFFINEFVWTFDPRMVGHDLPTTLPFDLFEYQERFVEWLVDRLEGRESGVVEKSRDTGFTWICAAFAVWIWLFKDGATVCFGSRKEGLVDTRGDPDSIFWKVRFLIDTLPGWLTPSAWERGGEFDNHLRIVNPENGSAITGEGGDNMGRGGRSILYFVDEWAYVSRAETVDAALSMNTEIVIYGSTHRGLGTDFNEKVQSSAFPTYRLSWKDDPRKSKEWRDAFEDKYGPTITAREVDVDPEASIDGLLIPHRWVQAAIDLEIDGDRWTKTVAGLDVADGGIDKTAIVPRQGPRVLSPGSRSQGNTTKTGRWAIRRAKIRGIEWYGIDAIGVGAGVHATVEDEGGDIGATAINVGSSPTDRVTSTGEKASEKFFNLRAELHWSLRKRFERTYEHVHGEAEHEPADLISLPNHSTLRRECSLLRYEETTDGKIKIESKDDLKDRINKKASPDFFDALVLAFSKSAVDRSPLIARAG